MTADDKLRPPHWLNPDSILGAVEHERLNGLKDLAWVVGIERQRHAMENRSRRLRVVWHTIFDVSGQMQVRNCTLRPDLWPVKPELAALFGEGGE